jgi:hypothetical protein
LFSSRSFLVFAVFAGGLGNILASGRSIGISTFYGMIALYILLLIIETFNGRAASRRAGSVRQVQQQVPA